MTFVHPTLLWALAAVAVPVIIHLFNFRRYKKVYFTNVKFLRELQEETKSRSRLKELLVLLCRSLAVACIVLAFCQPLLKGPNGALEQAGPNAVSLYIDNSFSTQNVNKQGPVFDIARQKAKEIVKAYGGADRFQILTNDFEGRHQRFLGREDALSAIDELKISPAVRQLSDVLKRQAKFLASSSAPNKKRFVFSDAQRTTFDLAALTPDTALRTVFVPLRANLVNNIYIDSCWFESPLQQKGFIQNLHAHIVNKGTGTLEAGSAKLFLNNQQVALASFSLNANTDTEVKFVFECRQEGFNFGSIKIEDYPVTFDDELFFSFNSRVNIGVSLINGKEQQVSNAFTTLFNGDSLYRLRSFGEQSVDYASFRVSNVVVLNQLTELSSGLVSELTKFTQQGGALIIIPARKANLATYNAAFLALKLPQLGASDSSVLNVDKIQTASRFYSGVFEKMEDRMNLPRVMQHYKLQQNSRLDFESILRLQNGDDFLGASTLNNAVLYLFSSPLNDASGNFNKHALFVPSIYKMSFSALKPVPLFYKAGANEVIALKNEAVAGERPPHIIRRDKTSDMIPEQRVINNSLFLYTRGQITRPGFYEAERNGQALQPLAFNYSRRESDLGSYSEEELATFIREKGWRNFSVVEDSQANIAKQVLQADGGKKLWKLFILLALGFIVVETTLLRLLK